MRVELSVKQKLFSLAGLGLPGAALRGRLILWSQSTQESIQRGELLSALRVGQTRDFA
jgi:hypothetical protein